MRFILGVLIAGLMCVPASAQLWYAKGEFNGWSNDNPLTEQDDNFYTGTLTGFFPTTPFEFKIATADWSDSAPNNNGKIWTDNNGEIQFNFWDITSWDDGWMPNDRRRVGYVDHQQFDWEIMSSIDNFTNPLLQLTDQGDGLHTGSLAFDAGFYQFKFRQQGSWETTIGNGDFSNSGSNNEFEVLTDGDVWNFELDLPNGRWRAFTNAAPPVLPGDHNNDGSIDAADYVMWRKTDAGNSAGYTAFRENYGGPSVPEGWYARGQFNNFGLTNPLTEVSPGHFSTTITGLTAGADFEYKIANQDFSESDPGSNGKVRSNASGEITFHYYIQPEGGWSDGWSPSDVNRVGYEDHQQFDWEIMTSIDGFTAPLFQLTDQGNGLHTGSHTFATAGDVTFKFRQQGSWDTSIGDNFGNSAANNPFTVANIGDTWNFELDLPNGKWRAYLAAPGSGGAVPEPSSLVLMLLAMAAIGGCARRK